MRTEAWKEVTSLLRELGGTFSQDRLLLWITRLVDRCDYLESRIKELEKMEALNPGLPTQKDNPRLLRQKDIDAWFAKESRDECCLGNELYVNDTLIFKTSWEECGTGLSSNWYVVAKNGDFPMFVDYLAEYDRHKLPSLEEAIAWNNAVMFYRKLGKKTDE